MTTNKENKQTATASSVDSIELLECACGGGRSIHVVMSHDDEYDEYWVECCYCGKKTSDFQRRLDAMSQWNKIAAL